MQGMQIPMSMQQQPNHAQAPAHYAAAPHTLPGRTTVGSGSQGASNSGFAMPTFNLGGVQKAMTNFGNTLQPLANSVVSAGVNLVGTG